MEYLTASELFLLGWLNAEDFGQYGECKGKDLDRLIELGLAQIHKPGEHQSGFIAQDHAGNRGDDFRAVSLTEAGIAEVEKIFRERGEVK